MLVVAYLLAGPHRTLCANGEEVSFRPPRVFDLVHRWFWCALSSTETQALWTSTSPLTVNARTSPYRWTRRRNSSHGACAPLLSVLQTTSRLTIFRRVEGLNLFTMTNLDAYICESLPGQPDAGNELSRFLGRDVVLMMKGPRPRLTVPTTTHPALGGPSDGTTVDFQDGYPLLIVSAEALTRVADTTRSLALANANRVDSKWKKDELSIRRCDVSSSFTT